MDIFLIHNEINNTIDINDNDTIRGIYNLLFDIRKICMMYSPEESIPKSSYVSINANNYMLNVVNDSVLKYIIVSGYVNPSLETEKFDHEYNTIYFKEHNELFALQLTKINYLYNLYRKDEEVKKNICSHKIIVYCRGTLLEYDRQSIFEYMYDIYKLSDNEFIQIEKDSLKLLNDLNSLTFESLVAEGLSNNIIIKKSSIQELNQKDHKNLFLES